MKRLCKNKHWKLNEEYNIDKILYLLIDRPDYINHWNDFIWRKNKIEWHRDYDLPSSFISNKNDTQCVQWWKNNKFYRKNNKPVKIRGNGENCYFIDEILTK